MLLASGLTVDTIIAKTERSDNRANVTLPKPLSVPFSTVQYLHATQHDVEYSIHAASHAMLSLVPVYVMSTGYTDIRTDCKTTEAQRIRPPRLFIYEHNGRSGMAAKAFNHVYELLVRSRQIIGGCPCNEVDSSGIKKVNHRAWVLTNAWV